jgi:hypothetical protein
MEGTFGPIGTFKTPQTGTVWTVNGNCGQWFMFTEKGYYLGHLFQGDNMEVHYPDKAVPGADLNNVPCGSINEAFGGSLTQGKDGQVYIQTGANALWNVLVTGFDQVTPIGKGKVEIKPEEVAMAQKQKEAQLQVAAGVKQINVKTMTPTFTGDMGKDFKGVDLVNFQKGPESAIQTAMAWDTEKLYLAWNVTDNTPWVNGATEPGQMYLNGDTVDFQFGSDPKADAKRNEAIAGDFRISIGNYQGKATAELYRPVSTQKKPMSFTSGVIAHYQMDYADQIPDADIKVTIRNDKKGYLVEAAIPWSDLGFTPVEGTKYRGDIGATHGNEGGTRTALRTYWSNQETGLVADAVFEVKLVPKNWGDFVFQK